MHDAEAFERRGRDVELVAVVVDGDQVPERKADLGMLCKQRLGLAQPAGKKRRSRHR
jgi:hypothetical protein